MSRKTWLFANKSKHKHIIYHWKLFSTTINNVRSLPQNMASFGSDQLSKFCQFVRKYVPPIWVLSSWVEGAITKRRWRGVGLHLETTMGVAGDEVSPWLPYTCSTVAVAEKQPSHQSTSFDSLPPVRVPQFTITTVDHQDVVRSRWESERDVRGERREQRRERRWLGKEKRMGWGVAGWK